MKSTSSKISKLMALCGAALAILAASMVSGRAQDFSEAGGLGFNMTAGASTALQGDSITFTASTYQLNDGDNDYDNNPDDPAYGLISYGIGYEYEDDYGDTYWSDEYYGLYYFDEYDDEWDLIDVEGHYAPWYLYTLDYEADTTITYSDNVGNSDVEYGTAGFDADGGNSLTFSFGYEDDGEPGPDITSTVAISDTDTDSGDDYHTYCYPEWLYSSDQTPGTASVTFLNPNTEMNVQIVGNSQLTEGVAPESTTIQIYRYDTYNTRTVHYTITGDAVNGEDYTATLTGTITIPAGSDYANINISTLANADLLDLDEPSSLTLTLSYDSMGTYQIGDDDSATITFQNAPVEDGTAQLTRSTLPPLNDQNIGRAKNGNSSISRSATNGVVSSSSAILNVWATGPYATSAGPTAGEFTITRSGWPSNSFTLNYTVMGTAIAGTNYSALPSSIVFAAKQMSTNLLVNVLTNSVLTNAQTVVFTLTTNSGYFLGYSTQAVVTILPTGAPTNTVLSPAGRYWRGTGSNPTYWSQVIPLDAETGTVYSNTSGNCSTLYAGLSSWSSTTLYHFNATNTLAQTSITNRIAFNNPLVAFGERVGGTPLYFSQPYNFGIYAGNPLLTTQEILVQVYYRTNFGLAGSIKVIPPNYTNAASMAVYATNGFQVTTNAFGLSTTLSDSPGLSWGTTSLGAYELTQTATSQSTNYYYLVEAAGYPASNTNAMVTATNGTAAAPSLLYTLEFEPRPAWRSIFLDQPQFAGNPLPPYYSGKTLAEMLTNTPPVTNAVTIAPSSATNLDDSPEVWRNPTLDNFVASMGNDPVALANYVINNIDLTDPMGYSDNGNTAEQSIDPGGVSRDAYGTFMEKQGSAVEQCELLVYLLRQAGVPAVYEFAPRNGLQIMDARLSQMLKFQIQGGVSEAAQLYTTNTMIPVNYPWVAAYIGTNWVHIFPWMKDYEITEGFNLWEYMPTNYSSAYPWARDFVYGKTNLLSLAVNGDNTPRVIFPAYLQQSLLQNYPGISVDDIGVQILNRQHYYARWQDFPTPTYVTNVSTSLESLTSPGITNISPTLTNVFDTVSVEVYSLNNVTNNIQTGNLRLCDLHNREFYIYQAITNTVQTNLVQLSLILTPFRTNITTQLNFSNDTNLLSREVLSMTLQPSDDQLSVRLIYNRHRSLAPSYAVNPASTFAGINAVETVELERPLLKGDQAAICMDYGRVTQDMLNVYATDLWQMQDELQLNPSLTNSLSPDLYLGAPMYLAGLSYYKKVSDFAAQNENLNKINILSTWAVGLSKMGAARDAYGNLTNGIDPVLPSVDMSFYQTTEVGNGTVQPNSNQTLEMAQQNFDLLSILDNSAEEHRVLNHFYQQTNAVSTVRLLQLSQTGGSGIVPLNINNYISRGTNIYQGAALQNWDPYLWSQITAAFQNAYDGNYVTAYITPGPITNSAYSGMAALVLGWGQWQALITPQSLNGAFGEPLASGAETQANSVNQALSGSDDPTMSFAPPGTGTVLAPTTSSDTEYPTALDQILSGDVLTSFATTWSSEVNITLNTAATGTPAQTTATAFTAAATQGNFSFPTFAISQQYSGSSDPVQNITGEHYIDATDLQLPGPLPLTLRRNYSSQNLADNQFGTGWKLSIMPFLSVAVGDTNIYAADMDGAVLAYVQTATNANVWLPTLGANPQLNNNTTAGVGGLVNRLRDRLVQTVSGSTTNYILYGADGSVRNFQVMSFNNGVLNQTRPYLQQWTDNRGNFYTFTYGTNSTQPNFSQVTRIQSSNGNYLGFDYDVNGHILDAYCGDGRRVTYEYDDYGDLITVTLPDTTTLSYIYQHATQAVTNGTATYSLHLLVEEDKPDGRALQNFYDGQRRVTNQLSTAGTTLTPVQTATFAYSNNFNITNSYTNGISGYTLVTDGNNHTTRYDYTNSLITKITDPLGQTIQQTWYADNATTPGYPRSLQQTIDKRGLVTQYKYDGNGNVTNAVVTGDLTGDGITTQTATNTAVYNANSLPVQMTDPAGNGTKIVYDPVFNFQPQQVIRLSGTTPVSTNFMYYGDATNVVVDGSVTQTNLAFGLMTRSVRAGNSPDAATNDLGYNGNGFLSESIRYSGTADPNVVLTYFYNERGQMVNQVDSLGAVTYLAYDAMGRTIEQDNYDEFGNDLSWNFIYYNDNGEVNWTEGPRYNPEDYVYYDYDGAGRRTTEIHWRSQANTNGAGVTTPGGYNLYAQTFYQYDPLGNLLLKVDPRGAMTTNTYDPLNRLVQTTHLDTNGATVLGTDGYSYEPGGQVQSHTNGLGGVTTIRYNILGKPESRSNPDGSTNGWRYYLDGRVYRELQSNGAYWQTTYDDVNRITSRTFYSAANVAEVSNSVQLDRRGNVIRRVDEGGNASTTAYDGLDRVKVAAGPVITNVLTLANAITFQIFYQTNTVQQISTNFYDAAGRAVTNINALGETTIARMDALGRVTANLIYSAAGTLVREHYTAYSADHNSVTVTDGSGANVISHTTWTDADGHTVLAIANPSTGATEFTLNQYDLAGNLIAALHDSSTGGTVTNWTSTTFAYDGLNRPISKIDRDNAHTTYAYDPLGDLINCTLPNSGSVSVQMLATNNNAGQKLKDWLVGGTSGTRTNTYTYFAAGSPFAGLLQTKVDGRSTTTTYAYDDLLRITNQAATGSLPEQNLTTSWQYEPRGYVISYSEQFASTNTGPITSVQRTFDAYGQLATESVNGGAFAYSAGQIWDDAGRRTALTVGGANYGYAWQADGSLVNVSNPTGSGNYTYNTAGILTGRQVGNRVTSITSLDGEGRPLTITNTVNTAGQLGETLSWSGDGLLTSHTLDRRDFTDNRTYSYANQSRRVASEQLNLNAASTWTNSFVYDRGLAGGPGALTTAGPINASFGLWWSGIPDAFSRVNTETNNAIGFLAYGFVNGQSTLAAYLDNQNIQILSVGTNSMQWRTFLELSPGAHQLKVSALHPSGFYTAWATNSFTNNIPYQVTADTFDGSGNITNRVFRNANGAINRTQYLSYDAKNRLLEVMERNTNNYGFNWYATYDGLNRRIATTTVLVSNGVSSTVPPQVVNSYFDPQVEFLELGVVLNAAPEQEFLQPGTSPTVQTVWKLYGPDLNGKYGGMNGVGGLEGVSPYLNMFTPVISDARGNVLAEVTNGATEWTLARPTGYGSVPGYRPVAYGNGVDFAKSTAWRGREVDVTGYYHLGLRDYDPVSGQWLSYDPMWNAGDPNGQSFCGGDPVNGFDSNGKCVENAPQNVNMTTTTQTPIFNSSSSQPNLFENNNSGENSSSETTAKMIDSANFAYDVTGEGRAASWTIGVGTQSAITPGSIWLYENGWAKGNGSVRIIGTVGQYAKIGGGFLAVGGIMYDYNNYKYNGESGLQFGVNTTVSVTAVGLSQSGLMIGGAEAGGPIGIALSGGYLAGGLINNYVPGASWAAQTIIQPITDMDYSPADNQVNNPNSFESDVNSVANPTP